MTMHIKLYKRFDLILKLCCSIIIEADYYVIMQFFILSVFDYKIHLLSERSTLVIRDETRIIFQLSDWLLKICSVLSLVETNSGLISTCNTTLLVLIKQLVFYPSLF